MLMCLLGSPWAGPPTTPGAVVYKGTHGPGKGKHVVLLAGDEEYRSEEALPQLAKILAVRHGFTCTVVFPMAPDGTVDPTVQTNEPGVTALRDADLCVMLMRFRHWPASQTKAFADYLDTKKPVLALRTSTHAFDYSRDRQDAYAKLSWDDHGGFGRQVLGETWVSHWGVHGVQGTRALPEEGRSGHPLLRGVGTIFVTTDVYEAHPPADAEVVLRGQVVAGLKATDPPATGKRKNALQVEQGINDPMMPVLWTRRRGAGHTVTTTMGAATDLLDEGLRRLLVNSVYWQLGLPVPAKADVDLVGDYRPSPFGFGKHKRGVKPADLALPPDGGTTS